MFTGGSNHTYSGNFRSTSIKNFDEVRFEPLDTDTILKHMLSF